MHRYLRFKNISSDETFQVMKLNFNYYNNNLIIKIIHKPLQSCKNEVVYGNKQDCVNCGNKQDCVNCTLTKYRLPFQQFTLGNITPYMHVSSLKH